MLQWTPVSTLMAGALSAIGASACCIGPLALLAAGIGGAWVSNLTALQPYQPVFVALTLGFLALAFRKLYLVRQPACVAEGRCANPLVVRRQRIGFWVVTVVLLALLAAPLAAPLFY